MTEKLIPPDRDQCQAETHQRAPFMQMGGPPVRVTRCANMPIVIATERKAGAGGKRGSMSLCGACLQIATKQLGSDHFTVRQIRRQRRKVAS